MGTSTMRQFLQSLCHQSCWSYAVYWKIEHEAEIILKWNDAYCDYLKLKGPVESKLDDVQWYVSDAIWSSSWGPDTLEGYTGDYSIVQAVADMASVQYPWGKGIIGEVACTGNHYWAFNDLIATGAATRKCLDEWVLQFTAGIKTILLVPVLPYGVLQLGSLEKVAECPELVGIIRDKFNAYQNNMGTKPTIGTDFHLNASSSVMPVMNMLDELSATTVNQIKPEHCNSMIQDAWLVSGKDGLDILSSSGEAESYVNPVGVFKESKKFDESANVADPDMIEDSMVRLFSLQEELRGFSHSDYCFVDMFGGQANENAEAYSDRPMMTENNWGYHHSKTFTRFDLDCELHKALGSAFLEHTNNHLWSSSLSREDVSGSSSHMFNRDSIYGPPTLTWESDAQHLLEAVVPSTQGSLNVNSLEKPNEVMSVPSSGQSGSLNKAQSHSRGTAYIEPKDLHSCVTSALASSITYAPSSPDPMMNTLTEEKQQRKDPQFKKGPKHANTAKRRGRPGENPKPRPRDRQLLQDRFKELRELVPNGSKCSIDGLLDRTIKHMLFLGSVSNQADKLRQLNCQQGIDNKDVLPSNTKYDQQNGKSWAVELGPELQVCPILVEDLGSPGYMLIEMRCDDHSVFLEIADAIRRLELTILKGVMETRDGNKWAHFIVEAPRGFHRLDILLPLMQLLQHN